MHEVKEEVSKDAHMEVKKESKEAAVVTERAGANEVSLLRKATFKLAETFHHAHKRYCRDGYSMQPVPESRAGMFSSLDKNHLVLSSHVNKYKRSKQTWRASGLLRSTERVL